jgi:tetratricopeptide (TPR) repeat protein
MTNGNMHLSSDSAAAREALAKAMHGMCLWEADFMNDIKAALGADPEFAMAHAVRALALTAGRHVRFLPMMRSGLEKAKAGGAPLSAHESAYIEALEHAVDRRPDLAIAVYKRILDEHPCDMFMHRLAQQELFNFGRKAEMYELAETAAPHWSPEMTDYPIFLSNRAFGNEEMLHYAEAERYGREAIERDPGDPWGAHAVAHVLVMQGRVEDGVNWLEGLCGNWAGKNQIVHHNWWHLCLFLLERGEHERILELFDTEVYNPASPLIQAMPDNVIDVTNVAALLLRLELRGVDAGERWQVVLEPAEGRIGNHAHPFTSAHAAIILAACGRFEQADELIRSMTDFADTDDGPFGVCMRKAALPAAKAAIAHRRGDHEAVVAGFMPGRLDLVAMGGSQAQRDVFFQILVDSCRQLGRKEELAQLAQDISAIGFEAVGQRTLYAEAFAA